MGHCGVSWKGRNKLSKNIWLEWFETPYNLQNVGCHNCNGHSDNGRNVTIGLEFKILEIAKYFRGVCQGLFEILLKMRMDCVLEESAPLWRAVAQRGQWASWRAHWRSHWSAYWRTTCLLSSLEGPLESRVILISMNFRTSNFACSQVDPTASLVSEQFLFSL